MIGDGYSDVSYKTDFIGFNGIRKRNLPRISKMDEDEIAIEQNLFLSRVL